MTDRRLRVVRGQEREKTYVYVVYKIIDGTPAFAGAYQDHDDAMAWCGDRQDVVISQVAFVPKR